MAGNPGHFLCITPECGRAENPFKHLRDFDRHLAKVHQVIRNSTVDLYPLPPFDAQIPRGESSPYVDQTVESSEAPPATTAGSSGRQHEARSEAPLARCMALSSKPSSDAPVSSGHSSSAPKSTSGEGPSVCAVVHKEKVVPLINFFPLCSTADPTPSTSRQSKSQISRMTKFTVPHWDLLHQIPPVDPAYDWSELHIRERTRREIAELSPDSLSSVKPKEHPDKRCKGKILTEKPLLGGRHSEIKSRSHEKSLVSEKSITRKHELIQQPSSPKGKKENEEAPASR